jgi:5S rRNA maturation endonuclease (ribonuclease M5)
MPRKTEMKKAVVFIVEGKSDKAALEHIFQIVQLCKVILQISFILQLRFPVRIHRKQLIETNEKRK